MTSGRQPLIFPWWADILGPFEVHLQLLLKPPDPEFGLRGGTSLNLTKPCRDTAKNFEQLTLVIYLQSLSCVSVFVKLLYCWSCFWALCCVSFWPNKHICDCDKLFLPSKFLIWRLESHCSDPLQGRFGWWSRLLMSSEASLGNWRFMALSLGNSFVLNWPQDPGHWGYLQSNRSKCKQICFTTTPVFSSLMCLSAGHNCKSAERILNCFSFSFLQLCDL